MLMNKDVLISINGLQVVEDTNDTVEVITVGEYYNRNGKHFIMYDEMDDDSGAITKNLVKISGESIEIKRTGMITTTMLFETDKINKSYYSTPFGDLMVEIETNSIDVDESDTSLDIKIDYALSVNNQELNTCAISIKVKETEA